MAACGSSPAAPAPVPVPVPPSTITLSGHVTATNGGQALPGLQATLGASTVSTDGSGGFTFQTLPTGALALALTGSGIVPRSVFIAAGSSRSVTVDAISTTGFDLNFYRELVRNRFDAPSGLEPLRRWTHAPNVYLRLLDDAGNAIDAKTLDSTESAIREAVPMWSGFTPTIERGSDTREGAAGWITVIWKSDPASGFCGQADVAREGGTIDLYYRFGGSCRCAGGPEIRPRTVRHEVGHAMGFWHTDSPGDLMSSAPVAGCDALASARELAAAAIAYARPVGNLDPDTDAVGTVALAVRRVP